MIDAYVKKLIDPPLERSALFLSRKKVNADHLTLMGAALVLPIVILLFNAWFKMAMVFILLNRLLDGLDGPLARISGDSDAGGFLDICCDFFFYASVPLAFAFYSPVSNALPAAFLLFSFVGTGITFLGFAIMADRHVLKSPTYPKKSFFYLGGLTEGGETILCFVAFCIWPDSFPTLAYIYAGMCIYTSATRLVFGYRTLKRVQHQQDV